MSPDDDIRRELEGSVEPRELDSLVALSTRLATERPLPSPAFRGRLGRVLVAGGAEGVRRRPRRLRVLVASYVVCGLVLLGVAGLGVADVGPLAPSHTSEQAASDVP